MNREPPRKFATTPGTRDVLPPESTRLLPEGELATGSCGRARIDEPAGDSNDIEPECEKRLPVRIQSPAAFLDRAGAHENPKRAEQTHTNRRWVRGLRHPFRSPQLVAWILLRRGCGRRRDLPGILKGASPPCPVPTGRQHQSCVCVARRTRRRPGRASPLHAGTLLHILVDGGRKVVFE